MRAPLSIALILGLITGALAQRSGLCVTGALRNYFLARERTLLGGLITAFVVAIVFSLLLGQFKWGINGQPASHLSHGWTFLAMTLVGLSSILIDGCPFRQLVKAGQGDVERERPRHAENRTCVRVAGQQEPVRLEHRPDLLQFLVGLLPAEPAAVDIGDRAKVVGGGTAQERGHERAVWPAVESAVDSFVGASVRFDQPSRADR